MNKTQQKEIVGRVKAKLEKNGGRIVLTAKQLGVTSVTLNSLIHGLRVYTKSWATFAKGVGLSSYIDEPKTGVRAKKVGGVKTGKKPAKAKPAKKVAPKKTASKSRRKSTTPKAKALASIAKAVSSLRGGKKAMNGVAAPAVAPPPPPVPSELPPPAPAE